MKSRAFILTLVLVALLALASMTVAQEDDTGDDNGDDNGFTSTINYFFVLCEDRVVVNFSGTMQAGFDVYYQVFSGPGGTGDALTPLRRIEVSGTYATSDTLNYTNGTLAPQTVGSAYVAIGAEDNPDNTLFTDFVDDLQDNCAEPQNAPATGVDVDGSAPTGTSDTTSGANGSPGTLADGTSAILSPFGGVVNPNYVPPDKPLVLVGPRERFELPRQETPGLIFAECEDYPVAEPGIVYDTDNVVVFWSWFTATEEQMLDHIENVQYSVTYYQTLPLPNTVRSDIRRIDGNYWVFYYSVLGSLRPGRYYIEYKANWEAPHFDGFVEFGPGTENEQIVSGCEFVVQPNPEGIQPSFNPWPYQFIGG